MPGADLPPVDVAHTLYFVRHGQTDWNKAQRLQGHTDIPLNDTGRSQAKQNGQTLAALIGRNTADIDFVVSPLSRAMETLEIMRSELGLMRNGYRTDPRLIEIDLGDWNGLTVDQARALTPDLHAQRTANKYEIPAPGGECYRDVALRVADFLNDVRQDTVIVGHGAAGRTLRALYLRLKPEEISSLDEPQDKVFRLNNGTVAAF